MTSRATHLATLVTGCTLWLGAAAGCQSPDATTSTPPTPPDSARLIARLADEESRHATVSSPVDVDVDIPPGVDPHRLSLRPAGDVKATMSPEQAIEHIVSRSVRPDARTSNRPRSHSSPRLSFRDRTAIQRHYAAGRQAALEGRPFIANQEFGQAIAIDPDDPAILRQLARSFAAIGNTPQAVTAYEQLRQREPNDPEANFVIGLSAARQGKYEDAVGALGPIRYQGDAFRHDPGANLLADYTLAIAFRHLGFDRAEVQLTAQTLEGLTTFGQLSRYRAEIESIRRRAGDLWLTLGDSRARLAEFERALAAYDGAESAGGIDPSTLVARRMYAHLRLGRVYRAQLLFLDAVRKAAPIVSDRLIRLATYAHEQIGEVPDLGRAIARLHREHPDEPGLVRLSASLLPGGEGISLLEDFLRRRPGDLTVARQLLGWFAAQDPIGATQLVAVLVRDHPRQAMRYVDLLYDELGLSSSLIDSLDRGPATDEKILVASRAFLRAEAPGLAWHWNERGLARDPASTLLSENRIDIAAALGEPELVARAASDGDVSPDVNGWVRRSRAWRAVNDADRAIDAAQRAVEVEPDSPDAWIALARSRALRIDLTREAIDAAEKAIALDPRNEDGYQLLVRMHSEGGAAEDSESLQRLWQRLNRDLAPSRLRSLIIADQFFAQRQYRQAVGELLPWYDTRPADQEVLTRLVSNWIALQDYSGAETWLNNHLRRRPDDAVLLRQKIRVLLQQNRTEEAESTIRARLVDRPDDPVARSLLEVVLRGRGARAEAFILGQQRLLGRPSGLRRSVDLASLYADGGRIGDAIAEIRQLLQRFNKLPRELAVRLVIVAGQLSEERDAEEVRLAVILRFADRWPDAPLSMYSAGLLSLARLDRTGSEFDGLLTRAINESSGGASSGLESVVRFRDLAQQLIEAGHPHAAAKVAFARLKSEHMLTQEGKAFLARVAQASFVVAGDGRGAREVIDWLDAAGELWILPAPADAANRRAEALYSLSVLSTLLGSAEIADALLLDALTLEPDHGMALNNLGYRRLEQNHGDDRTIQLIERAFDLSPDNSNVLDTVAWLRYKQGLLTGKVTGNDGALELIERTLAQIEADRDDPNPEVLDHRGDILWRLGKKGPAIEGWAEALRLAESGAYRTRMKQNYLRYQRQAWGVVGADPDAIYERINDKILVGTRLKIEAARAGEAPPLSPTFDEVDRNDRNP